MIATSAQRVMQLAAPSVAEEIRRQTEMRVAYFAAHPEGIPRRLAELDSEWDIERALETAASALSLMGFVLGVTGRRRWLLLPLVVQGFFLQHAIQGWCPPAGLVRRMGVRTRAEIEAERYALKAIKGDFRGVIDEPGLDAQAKAERALRAVEDGRTGTRGGAGQSEAAAEPEAPLFNQGSQAGPPSGAGTGPESKAPEPQEKDALPPTDTGPTS